MSLRLLPLLLAAALIAQQAPVEKSPATRQAELETAVIQARLENAAAVRRREALAQTDETRRLEAEAALRVARAEAAAAEAEAERAALARAAALDAARRAAGDSEAARRRAELEAETKLIQAEGAIAIAKADSALALSRARESASRIASRNEITRPRDPVVDGTLRISDRRIPFNGPVNDQLSNFVCERIAFYNAQSPTDPIFIVIDSSPGGSVMSGYQILRAMRTSRAPVYVVVKTYAASMAAVVTTLAERSFCYPNTIVLHHQPSTIVQGNLTQINEQLKWTNIWCGRINQEVAAKLGITIEEFVKQMYAATVTGDWAIMGDEAVRRRWVSDLVERISEDSVETLVSVPAPPAIRILGATGEREQIPLPVLQPGDIWLMHDPNSIYLQR